MEKSRGAVASKFVPDSDNNLVWNTVKIFRTFFDWTIQFHVFFFGFVIFFCCLLFIYFYFLCNFHSTWDFPQFFFRNLNPLALNSSITCLLLRTRFLVFIAFYFIVFLFFWKFFFDFFEIFQPRGCSFININNYKLIHYSFNPIEYYFIFFFQLFWALLLMFLIFINFFGVFFELRTP